MKFKARALVAASGMLFVVSTSQAGLFGSSLPKTEEYPKIQEIYDVVDDIDLDSKKETLKDCKNEIKKDLPNAIAKVDQHLDELDNQLKIAHRNATNIDDFVPIAEHTLLALNRQLSLGEAPAQKPLQASDFQSECSKEAEEIKPFSAVSNAEVAGILDASEKNVDACVNRFKTYRKSVVVYQGVVEGGKMESRLKDEIKDTDLAIQRLGDSKAKIEALRDNLLKRYSMSLKYKQSENDATLARIKAGEKKCLEFAQQISTLEQKTSPGAAIGSISSGPGGSAISPK